MLMHRIIIAVMDSGLDVNISSEAWELSIFAKIDIIQALKIVP